MSDKKTSPAIPLIAGMSALAYYFFVRPQLIKWGTRLGESQRRLPGDDIIPRPNLQVTFAQDIDAPAEAVWPWLAQMGRERSGYYGLDMLENYGIPSVTYIRQDLPAPEVGMAMDGGYHIIEVVPNRELLFGGFNLQRPFGVIQDMSVLYLLERRSDGKTRLLVRRRGFSYGPFGPIFNLIYELLYFWAAKQQLATLKQYAESRAYLHTPQAVG